MIARHEKKNRKTICRATERKKGKKREAQADIEKQRKT